ncbi:MAG TPA: hypothetical protein VGU61_20955 [Noviherbaspirillum sp.]|nr:hypothetical protein [Noviherbaspirillum sp.]
MPYNRGMNHLDILIPFALPPAELAADLIRELKAPSLALLIARSKATTIDCGEQIRELLPHEAWLSRQLGLADGDRSDISNSPQVAIAAMQSFGVGQNDGYWFVLNPVHIHIARDHLVLTDQRQLHLSDEQSRELFDIAQPLFQESGKSLVFGNSSNWFMRADDWRELRTCTPDAACGHNIDLWMPKGKNEREWRKLQNEVQMHWHGHAINEERESRGMKPVNSIWLWGGASAARDSAKHQHAACFNAGGWMDAFGMLSGTRIHHQSVSKVIAAPGERGLLCLDTLIEPVLAHDWSNWLQRMQEYDADWFAPLHEALKSGKIGTISIIASRHAKMAIYNISRHSLRKFWVKSSLMPLCS